MNFMAPPFPLEHLPERLRFVLFEAHALVQSPYPLVFGSAIAALSTAFQGAIDVEMPTGAVVPPSLIVFTIAESGERKTSTDNIFLGPIHAMQQRVEEERLLNRDAYEADLTVWSLQRKSLQSKLQKVLKHDGDCEAVKLALTAHLRARPLLPCAPHFVYADTTIEALLQNLHSVWPHAAMISSEASSIVNGRSMQQLGPINEFWDGVKLLRVDRKTTESFSIRDARLTVSLMLQRGPFEQFLRRNDSAAWETGLLARALIAEPMSSQGMRQVQASSGSAPQSGYLEAFHARVTEVLAQSIAVGMGQRKRKVLRFNPEAKAAWLEFAAWVESQLSPSAQFASVKGFASKLANNMVRLAALMHYLESDDEEIGMTTAIAAIELCHFYAAEYLRLFGVKDQQSIALDFGYELENWLWLQYKKTGICQFSISQLYKIGPNKIRKRDAMNVAIDVLAMAGKVYVVRHIKPAHISLNTFYGPGI